MEVCKMELLSQCRRTLLWGLVLPSEGLVNAPTPCSGDVALLGQGQL